MYQAIDDFLKQINSAIGTSELHGIICGQIITNPGANTTQHELVIRQFLDVEREANHNEIGAITTLYQHAHQELSNQDFDFSLLLPNDNTPIQTRVDSLSKWCEGFLFGFGLNTSPEQQLSPEAEEILKDFVDISQASWEASSNEEEDLNELVEYVRMATIFLYMECNPITKSQEALLH